MLIKEDHNLSKAYDIWQSTWSENLSGNLAVWQFNEDIVKLYNTNDVLVGVFYTLLKSLPARRVFFLSNKQLKKANTSIKHSLENETSRPEASSWRNSEQAALDMPHNRKSFAKLPLQHFLKCWRLRERDGLENNPQFKLKLWVFTVLTVRDLCDQLD